MQKRGWESASGVRRTVGFDSVVVTVNSLDRLVAFTSAAIFWLRKRALDETNVERIAGNENLISPLERIHAMWANPKATPEMTTCKMRATPLTMSISIVQRRKKLPQQIR
jgi:hypothetical protein